MTTLVARLAEQGLVERQGDPTDGRAVLLALTPAGADLLDQRRAARAERLSGPLSRLADDDVRRITNALPALARLAGVLTHSQNRHGGIS
ncbi:Winged helix DNA-binding domain-containing protein [Modestobacter sp. DSM 44400]|nr:Winged helix DNA-binding domain-containing protein [Modestobacter sp. DSM 44400]